MGVPLNVSVAASVTGAGLRLVYTLAGNITALQIPRATAPGSADGLWQHTCLEAFVATEDDAAYREFNFAPSGQWAIYDFARERVRVRVSESADAGESPIFQTSFAPDQFTLTADLAWAGLPARGAALCLGLSAVVEESTGQLSYWALTHPGERPDFHHPAGRTLRLVLSEN